MRSRRFSWLGVLLVLAIAPPGIRDASAAADCVSLKRLLGLADTQFRRLRGYYDPRFQAWVATYRMSGATICTIQDAENVAYYSCKWVHDPAAGTVPEAHTALLERVTRCLDVGATSQHDAGPGAEATRLGIAGAPITVVVGKSESSGGGHFVTLDIVPMGLEDFPAH